jgi:hypothetical protein
LQARENEARRNLKAQQEDDDNKTEMANNIYGDFLTENPACATSAFGAHRVIPDRWKGMTPEQIADIKRQQDIQRKEKQVRCRCVIHILNTFYSLYSVRK